MPVNKNIKVESESNNKEDRIAEIREKLRINYIRQKKLMKELKKLTEYEEEPIEKFVKPSVIKFNDPISVPEKIIKLLGLDNDSELSFATLSKLIFEYITENKLYNKKEGIIKHNIALRKALDINKDDTLTLFNLQSYIRKTCDK